MRVPIAMEHAFASDVGVRKSATQLPQLQFDVGCILRNLPLVVACIAGCLGLALIYLALRSDVYTSRMSILLDRREMQIAAPDAIFTVSTISAPWVQTQVELLKSNKIARSVVSRLALDQDPELIAPSLRERLGSYFRPNEPQVSSEETNQARAARALQKKLNITRNGETFLIDVSATTGDPGKSAKIADGVAQAYLEEVSETASQIADAAVGWLRDRARASGPSARIVSHAEAPPYRDPPGVLMSLILATMAGFGLGISAALARENLRKTIGSTDQLAAASHTPCVGVLPFIAKTSHVKSPQEKPAAPTKSSPTTVTPDEKATVVRDGEAHDAVPVPAETPLQEGNNSFAMALGRQSDTVFSTFTQSIDNVATVLFGEERAKYIGVTSTSSGEGKTFVSRALSHAMASGGNKVLVIDSVGGSNSLTEKFNAVDQPGLISLLKENYDFARVVMPADDIERDFDFLPFGSRHAVARGLALKGSRLRQVLKAIAGDYDAVIFDLPAIERGGFVRAVAPHIDAILLIAASDTSDGERLAAALDANKGLSSKIVGAVLNKVDLDRLMTYPGQARWVPDRAHGISRSLIRSLVSDAVLRPIRRLFSVHASFDAPPEKTK